MFGSFLDRNRPRNVVFYGRVSTEHEAQLSALENQMQWYEDVARRFPNWTVVDKYIDEGITGTQAKKRPAFMKMIEDSEKGKFDLIVTREVCRFARNTVDTLTHTRALRNLDIEVYFVDDNIWTMDGDGELRLTIMATLAQEESRKVSERVKAGQHISRSKNVIYGNGNILGYELIRHFDADGRWNAEENEYRIIPEDAETIRMIFNMYLNGEGCLKIAKELLRLKRKNASGKISWNANTVNHILKNATYKGYLGYHKSRSNNFLEQKRITNYDIDSYEYVKGNFEPIVSEEVWDKCLEIRKKRLKPSVISSSGDVEKVSRRSSKDLWTEKLRCSCGSRFRKNRYHKDKDGKITYNYVCYNQVNHGKASERAKYGLDTEGYCNEAPITEWKMDMMGKFFLAEAWQNRKDDLMVLLEYVKAYYKSEADKASAQNQEFIDAQIAKLEKKMENLLDIYAEAEISKEEYRRMRGTYENELTTLREQKETFLAQKDVFGNCIDDMDRVAQILSSMVDLSSPDLPKGVLNECVTSIVPEGNNGRYLWKFRLTKEQNGSCGINVSGTKKCSRIYLDEKTEEASDTDASDLHIFNTAPDNKAENLHNFSLLPIAKAYPKKLSLLNKLHRLQLLTSNTKKRLR